MLATTRSTSSSSASGVATRLTSPLARACSALMNSPVTSISKAALRPMLRDRATAGVEQNRPRLTPLTAKRALEAATARSHMATSWQPAAVATPCTLATTGTGSFCRAIITLPHSLNRAR
jgi:hypothetical protein